MITVGIGRIEIFSLTQFSIENFKLFTKKKCLQKLTVKYPKFDRALKKKFFHIKIDQITKNSA